MKRSLHIFLSTVLSLGSLAIQFPSEAAAAPSQQLPAGVTALQLNPQDVVPEIVALGITPAVYKVSTPQLQKLKYDEDKYVLKINIGRVSADQFAKLKALYGGLSQVPYDSNKAYDLVDFLPPAIQATVNKTFAMKYYDTSTLINLDIPDEEMTGEIFALQKNGIGFYTNCWGTTLEVLKSLRPRPAAEENTYILSWPGRWSTHELFTNKKYSSAARADALRFGDALAVFFNEEGGSVIQHTSLMLSKNLVFEKTDTSENDPYRIALHADVRTKYAKVFGDKGKISYRRFGVDKAPIPMSSPTSDFTPEVAQKILKLAPDLPLDSMEAGCEDRLGGGCDIVFTEMRILKIETDPQTGRGRLKGDARGIDQFKPL